MSYYNYEAHEPFIICPKCKTQGNADYDENGYWDCATCNHSFFDPAYDFTDGDDSNMLAEREEQRYEDGYYDTYDDGSGNEISIEDDIWDH